MSNGRSPVGVFVVLLLVAAAIVGFIWHIQKPAIPTPDVGMPSKRVDIDVYVDGTGSIRNLLVAPIQSGGKNYLRDFLRECQLALEKPGIQPGWEKAPVHLWKFGSGQHPVALPSGKLTIMADNPMASDAFGDQETSIEVPAADDPQQRRQSKDAEVKVIVTDLYQSNQAIETVVDPLVDKFPDNSDWAVAVLGIRNPYSGGVDDLRDSSRVPGGPVRLPKGAADSMPFYVIIAGDHAVDVRIAREALLQNAGLGDALSRNLGFSLFFSKDSDAFLQQSRTFAWQPAVSLGHGSCKESHEGTFSAPQNSTQSREVEFSWSRPSGKPADTGCVLTSTQQADPKEPNRLIPLLSWKKSGLVKVSWTPQGASGASQDKGADAAIFELGASPKIVATVEVANRPRSKDGKLSQSQEASASAAAAVVDKHYDPSTKTFEATIDGKPLSHGRTYLFRFDVIAQSRTTAFHADQPLMNRWNIEDSEPKGPEVFLDKATGRHPARTPHLSEFLTALQDKMFGDEDHPVKVATYYLYVKGR
jgi:hypothetical protein